MSWTTGRMQLAIGIMDENILLPFLLLKTCAHVHYFFLIHHPLCTNVTIILCLETFSYVIYMPSNAKVRRVTTKSKSWVKKGFKRNKVHSQYSHECASVTFCPLRQEISQGASLQEKYTSILKQAITIKVLRFYILKLTPVCCHSLKSLHHSLDQ